MPTIIRGPNSVRSKAIIFVQVRLLSVLLLIACIITLILHSSRLGVFWLIALGILAIMSLLAFLLTKKPTAILLAGYRGEQSLAKVAKKVKGSQTILLNLPLTDRKRETEIDLLMITPSGILIVEAKNYSGRIIGDDTKDEWTQIKETRQGGTTRTTMRHIKNPFRQTRRQRDILKSILDTNNMGAWVSEVVYFPNQRTKAEIKLSSGHKIAVGEDALLSLLQKYRGKSELSREECYKIVNFLKLHHDHM